MPGINRPHNDSYGDLSRALKRKGARDNLPCWICREAIDYTLDWRHPMAYTYDHVDPINAGGKARGEGRPAHRSCNSRRGDGSNQVQHVSVSNVSIDWLDGPARTAR